jgi:pyruvate,water dikinase
MIIDLFKQFSEKLFIPDHLIRKRFDCFKKLLELDRKAHILLAGLEEIYYGGKVMDINAIRVISTRLSCHVALMISSLNALAPGRYKNLIDYHKKIDFYIQFALVPPKVKSQTPYVVPLESYYEDDFLIGGKALHLSQLGGELNLPVPRGFILSSNAWNRIVEYNDLRPLINKELARIDIESIPLLEEVASILSHKVLSSVIPPEILGEVQNFLINNRIKREFARYAVRSSCVGEDSSVSFAGQYLSLLNVAEADIIQACLKVMASKYSPEALLYRIKNGFDDEAVPMAVLLLEMIEPDFSGVIVTNGLQTDGNGRYAIHFVKGFGDKLMSGEVVSQMVEVVLQDSEFSLPGFAENSSGMSENSLAALGDFAYRIERHYGTPQEIEWCRDRDGGLHLLQTRQVQLSDDDNAVVSELPADLNCLFTAGQSASAGTASGEIFILKNVSALQDVPPGVLLVCEVTPPSFVTILPRVSGIIVRFGNSADHFSSVAREFRVPVLVQVGDSLNALEDGMEITLCSHVCSVYQGKAELEVQTNLNRGIDMQSPVGKALKMAIDFCSPLGLHDPGDESFCPEGCRSFHDIIRFVHEKSTQAMFLQNADSFFRKPKSLKLVTDIPIDIRIIDLDKELSDRQRENSRIIIEDIRSIPFLQLWKGLTNPGVNWHGRSYFDWKSHDNIALAGGVSLKNDSDLASYCLVSREYLNFNMRFGYHFALLDCLCGKGPEENYILMRFAGGGGTEQGKDLRLDFLSQVLGRLDFTCERSGDLLDARLLRYTDDTIMSRLETLGCLLGAVRLLDMVLKDGDQMAAMVDLFFTGTYDFSSH